MFEKMNVKLSDNEGLCNLFSYILENTSGAHINQNETEEERAIKLQIVNTFEATLNRDQLKMYCKLDEVYSDDLHIETNEAFIMGYKAATRLLSESLK